MPLFFSVLGTLWTLHEIGRALRSSGSSIVATVKIKAQVRSAIWSVFPADDARFVSSAVLSRKHVVDHLLTDSVDKRASVLAHFRDIFKEAGRTWGPIQIEAVNEFVTATNRILIELRPASQAAQVDILSHVVGQEGGLTRARFREFERRVVDSQKSLLTLSEFRAALLARDSKGYSTRFSRLGWETGDGDLQRTVAEFLASDPNYLLLVTAPGGYGKTRTALELGIWVERSLKVPVRVALPGTRVFPSISEELPSPTSVIIVDDAESIDLPSLLDKLGKDGKLGTTRIICFARIAAEPKLRQVLGPYKGLRVANDKIPQLTFSEAEAIFQSLGLRNEAWIRRIFQRSNQVPFFLVLMTNMLLAGKNPYTFTTEEGSVEHFVEEHFLALEQMGVSRTSASRVLGCLAMLRGVQREGERSLMVLGELSGTSRIDVEEILSAAVKIKLVQREADQYRFSYDLIAECVAIMHCHPSTTVQVLSHFEELGSQHSFQEVFRAGLIQEFQLGADFLGGFVTSLVEESATATNQRREELLETIVPALLTTRPSDAFRLIDIIIGTPQPVQVAESSFAGTLKWSHSDVIKKITPILIGVASYVEFRPRLLQYCAVLAQGGDGITDQLMELVRAVAKPVAGSPAPFIGLEDSIATFERWLAASEGTLPLLAIAGLSAVLEIEQSQHLEDLANPLQIEFRSWRWSLSHPDYATTLERARLALMAAPDATLHRYQKQYLSTISNTIRGLISAVGSDQDENAVEHVLVWLQTLIENVHRFSAEHLSEVLRDARWLAVKGDPRIRGEARQLVDAIKALPDYAIARVFFDPVSAWDLDEMWEDGSPTSSEKLFPQINSRSHEYARRVVEEFSGAQLAEQLRVKAKSGLVSHLGHGMNSIIRIDQGYGLSLFEELESDGVFTGQALGELSNIWTISPELAVKILKKRLSEGKPEHLQALAVPIMDLLSVPEFLGAAKMLTANPDTQVRASLAQQLWRSLQNGGTAQTVTDFLTAILSVEPIDEILARAVGQSLWGLKTSSGAPIELAKTLFEKTEHLPLRILDHGGVALREISAVISKHEPTWLLEHLERRAEIAKLGARSDVLPLFGVEVMFVEPPQDPRDLEAAFSTLASWLSRVNDARLKHIAAPIFQVLARSQFQRAAEFVEKLIESASDETELVVAIRLGLKLPDDDKRINSIESALLKAHELSLGATAIHFLQNSVISAMRSGVIRGGRAGEPFPADVALRDLARRRLDAISTHLEAGEAGFLHVKALWERVRDLAERDIKFEATLTSK